MKARAKKYLQRIVARMYRRVCSPIKPATLREAIHAVSESRPKILIVHSSLSKCGHFTAGPDDVLNAFQEACDNLVLPTHTYCYPELPGAQAPIFDGHTTPSVVGRLTELFRVRPGVVRSIHSTHSLAAAGPLAEWICAGHYHYDTPCGKGTPYERLLHHQPAVLLFGVSFLHYTLFHTAEDSAESPCAYHPEIRDLLRFLKEDGSVGEKTSRRQSREPFRFVAAGETLIHKGLARRIRLGDGDLTFVPNGATAHEFLIRQLRATPDYLRASYAHDGRRI